MEGRGRSRRHSPHRQWKRRLSSVLAIVLTAVMVLNMPLSIDGLGLHVSNAFASASNADRMDSVWATASNAKYRQGESQDVDIYVIADDDGAVPGNTSSMTLYLKNNTNQMITEGVLTFKGSHIQKEDGVFQDIGAGDEASQVIVSGPGQDDGQAAESGAAGSDGVSADNGTAGNGGTAQGVSGNDAAQGTGQLQDTVISGEGLLYKEPAGVDEDDENADFTDDFEDGEEEIQEEETWKLTEIDLQPGEMHEVSFAFYTDEDVKSTKANVKFSFTGEDEEGETVRSDTQFYYSIGLPHVNISLEDGMQIESNVNNDMEIWMIEPDWVDEDLEERIEEQEEKEAEKEQEADDGTEDAAGDNSGGPGIATDSNASKSDASRADTASDSQADREEKPSVIRDEEKIDKYTDEAMTISESKVSYTVEIFGAEYDLHARKADEAEDIGWISCVYKIAKETQPGIYYGKVTAAGRWNNKKFTSEQGFLFEVTGEWTGDYTAESENVIVHAHAEDGVLPKNVTLKVTELEEGGAEYARAREAMDGTDTQFDGMTALDIRFENQNGEEVEPEGEVQISIEMKEGLLPADAALDTVEVHHLKELDEETIEVETVADAAGLTDGTVKSGEEVQAEQEEIAADAQETAEETEASPKAYARAAVAAAAAAPVTLDAAPEVDKDTVAVAEFSVESFSTFTITWGYGQHAPKAVVHYVDTNGKPIAGPPTSDISVYNNEWIDLSDYAVAIEGFSGPTIRLTTYRDGGTEAKEIRYYNGWRYRKHSSGNGSRLDWVQGELNVYFVYELKTQGSLTTADTVDSTSQGVHMYMFNYDTKPFNGGEYGTETGSTKIGLASSKVNADGWPSLTGVSGTPEGESFKKHFGGSSNAYELSGNLNNKGRQVNHLFLKENYDVNGQYYFNSAEYFATLKDDNDNDFTVYNQLGTPSGENNYFYQRGNFMPYNTLNLNRVQNYNLYDDTGAPLTLEDERVNEPIYGFKESNNDYLFGMYVWADFYQPQDGMVKDNEGEGSSPMRFEFTGDDDMWVYIDGVLVLDLGGIHDAQSGYIDFSTGGIGWTDTETNKEPDWNYTNLLQVFQNVSEDDSVNWNGNTFADGSNHRIQIFYMERGEGASNLKMSFNLKTIPDGRLSVEKRVENYYAPQLEDIKYTMKVTVDGEPYANQPYTFHEQSGGGETNDEGEFKLKYGQTAVFSNLQADQGVKVEEIGASRTPEGVSIEQAYDISYVVTDGAGNQVGEGDSDKPIEATMPGYGSIEVVVTNTAKFTRPLQLIKKFEGTANNTVPENFEATYTICEVDQYGSLIKPIGSVKYTELTNQSDSGASDVFWLDTEKYYTIVESFEKGDNKGDTDGLIWHDVETASSDLNSLDLPIGVVYLEEDDAIDGKGINKIELTNIYGGTTVNVYVDKVVTGNMGDKEKPFEFSYSYTGANRTTVTGTFKLTHSDAFKEITIPYGSTITITETDSRDGYTTTYTYGKDENNQSTSNSGTECALSNVTEDILVIFTNSKGVQTPTGFTGNSYPYVIMLAIAAVGATSFIYPACRRRRRNGDR